MEFRYGVNNHRLSIKAKNLFLLVVMLVIASTLLPACGGSQDLVVGSWKAVSTTGPRVDGTLFHRRSTMEFFKDGTLDVEGKTAKWSWLADSFMTVEFSEEAYVLETTLGDTLGQEELTVRDRGYGGDAIVIFIRDLSRKSAPDQSTNKKPQSRKALRNFAN